MIIYAGAFTYEKLDDWDHTVRGYRLPGMVSEVAVDSQDNVYAFCRPEQGEPPMLVFSREGDFLATWGAGIFTEPHGLYIDADDMVYVTDREDHTVRKFTKDGDLLMTLGTAHQTGAPGMPFNRPTKAVVGPGGDIFVADGYGQERVHRFSPTGELLHSWGEKGSGPGQLLLPHGIWVDRRDRVMIADRYNNRISLFDQQGNFLEAWPVTNANDIYVRDDIVYATERPVAIFSMDGERIGGFGDKGTHALCVDSQGSIYLVTGHYASDATLEKYVRR
jgi:DNA-binding beta-propeller fold protein YncE